MLSTLCVLCKIDLKPPACCALHPVKAGCYTIAWYRSFCTTNPLIYFCRDKDTSCCCNPVARGQAEATHCAVLSGCQANLRL